MQTYRTSLLLSLTAFLLTSCGGMLSSDKPAERVFWLNPYNISQAAHPGTEAPGLVMVFSVVPGLDSDRLLTLTPNAELNQFTAARWPDYLPEFAGSLMRRSLQDSGRFAKVSAGHNADNDSCLLELEAHQFYTKIDRNAVASMVQIAMSGFFACKGINIPVELDAHVVVSGQDISDIVSAHQAAMDQLIKSLLIQLDAGLDLIHAS